MFPAFVLTIHSKNISPSNSSLYIGRIIILESEILLQCADKKAMKKPAAEFKIPTEIAVGKAFAKEIFPMIDMFEISKYWLNLLIFLKKFSFDFGFDFFLVLLSRRKKRFTTTEYFYK